MGQSLTSKFDALAQFEKTPLDIRWLHHGQTGASQNKQNLTSDKLVYLSFMLTQFYHVI